MTGPVLRSEALDRLREQSFDFLVIGGGITGAGIALDACTRGLRVGLIERNDFASGTSSKSSKLIHGGLRYLETRDLRLVREAVAERELLVRQVPNLVTPLEFYWGRWAGAGKKASLGLSFYDSLAGSRGIGKHRSVSEQETSELVPGCRSSSEGFVYFDAQTDDVRLTLAILRQARLSGAVVCNHVRCEALLTGTGQVHGVFARDGVGGESFEILADTVINATGVWADTIGDGQDHDPGWRLEPSKGVHIVLKRSSMNLRAAVLFPSVGGGLIFAVPWRSSVLVGTTDEKFDGDIDSPGLTSEDYRFLEDSLSASFEGDFGADTVCGAYAGLRPLLAGRRTQRTRDLSRQHQVFRGPSGLITITGGKLTTYRTMAEEAVDLAVEGRGTSAKSQTAGLVIGGEKSDPRVLGLEPEQALSLIRSYGETAVDVASMAGSEGLTSPLVDGLPYLEAEVVWSVQQEMAVFPSDVLARRTRVSIEDRNAGEGSRGRIIDLMSKHRPSPEPKVDLDEAFDAYLDEVAKERGPGFRS